jgi:uncharacterized coiled-coil protein SlyX
MPERKKYDDSSKEPAPQTERFLQAVEAHLAEQERLLASFNTHISPEDASTTAAVLQELRDTLERMREQFCRSKPPADDQSLGGWT